MESEVQVRLVRKRRNSLELSKCETLLLIILCVLSVSGQILSSASYIFEGFSPYATLRFFEFSDKGWNISENCLRDMYNFLEGLKYGTPWAIKLYDASSYYAGGALGGASTTRIHNPNICRSLFHQYKHHVQDASWNFLSNSTVVPFVVQVIVAHYLLEIVYQNTSRFEKVQQLVCFPSSCNYQDLAEILDVYQFQNTQVVKNIKFLRHRVLNDIYNVRNETTFFNLIIFLCSFIFIYALFFILRSYNSFLNSSFTAKNRAAMKFPPIKPTLNNGKRLFGVKSTIPNTIVVDIKLTEHQSTELTESSTRNLTEILHTISLHYIVKNLFDGVITPQTVISVIFTLSLMYEYLRSQTRMIANNSTFSETDGLTEAPLMHLGSFFGCNLTKTFTRTFPCDKLKVFKQLKFVAQLILHKFLSFYTSRLFCIFGENLLDKYFHNKIALELPSLDFQTCSPKLSNIFYLDIFFPIEERCMPWTWYISLEMQFFIFISLVLLLKEIHQRFAIIIITSGFIISTVAATAWEVYPYGHNFLNSTSLEVERDLSQFNLIYDNIWLRFAPYAFGVCMGQVLPQVSPKMKNIFVIIYGWITYLLMFALFSLACWYGNNLQFFSSVRRWYHATLLVAAHLMWSLILLWTMLIVESQFWSPCRAVLRHFKYFHVLDKLSPISLLIAPIIIKLLVFSADAPINASFGHTIAIFVGYVAVTHVCALVLYVLFDGLIDVTLRALIPELA